MADDEQRIEILRFIIDAGQSEPSLPLESALRAELPKPWILDELLERQWVAGVALPRRIVPTIEGLRRANTDSARRWLDEVRRLFELLRLERSRGTQSLRTASLTNDGTSDTARSKNLFVLAAAGLLGSYSSDGGTDTITQFALSEEIQHAEPFEIDEPGPNEPVVITIRNFRGLGHVEWAPSGVVLLAGANGTGKSSLLESLTFLKDVLQRSVPQTVVEHRGPRGLVRLDSGATTFHMGLRVGDVSWELDVPVLDRSTDFAGEVVRSGHIHSPVRTRFYRAVGVRDWFLGSRRQEGDLEGSSCLSRVVARGDAAYLEPLVARLRTIRIYDKYGPKKLRAGGDRSAASTFLSSSGLNLFTVLRNWQSASRRFENRFDWVMAALREAFPGQVDALELDALPSGDVDAYLLRPGSQERLPIASAADGLLVGLLHLTAVAGAAPYSIIAIDEMENHLHPHAIRTLLAAMRARAEEQGLTIILTSHSPTLMNEFRDVPEQFYVMDPAREVQPARLTDLYDPDWLMHFSLGDLYDRLEIAAPPKTPQVGEE